jgi:hypothetical protein
MASEITEYTVVFPQWYDARAEYETPAKGHLSEVEIRLEDGSRYQLYFIDPVRLQQTLEDDTEAGRPYFAEPGLVVLPEVSTEAIRQAVPALLRDGYFRHLKPLS